MTKKYEILEANIRSVHMTHMELMGGDGKRVDPHRVAGFSISWTAKDIGFGEFSVIQWEDGSFEIESERMSRDFVKSVFSHLIDKAKFDGEEKKDG